MRELAVNEVRLCTGETVASNSEEWRAECEARYLLGMSTGKRIEFLGLVRARRGGPSVGRLEALAAKIEPHYVLGMLTKDMRHGYLAKIREQKGANNAAHLKAKILHLHAERQAEKKLAASREGNIENVES